MNTEFRKPESITEIHSIGLMRGLASIMVCYFHLSRGNERFFQTDNHFKQLGYWAWTGVEIFFIISGFIIPYSMYIKKYSFKNIVTFFKKRIIRIEPPYIISIILVLTLNYLSTLSPLYRGRPIYMNWENIFGHLAYLNVFTGQKWLQDTYWTLAIEFQYYIIISVAYFLIISSQQFYRIIFFILFMGSAIFRHDVSHSLVNYVSYFMLGVLLFQYYCRLVSNIEFWILFLTCFFTIFYFDGIVLSSIAGITLLAIVFIKSVPNCFKFLGNISYSLYLVHIPIGGRIINITESISTNIFVREIMLFIALTCSILFSYFFYSFIEKRFKKASAAFNYNHLPS